MREVNTSKSYRLSGGRAIKFVSGSEGPRQDPYAFEETILLGPTGGVKIHTGLALYVEKANGDRTQWTEKDLAEADAMFAAATGLTARQCERAVRKLCSRCRKCRGKRARWVAGYPGESICVCARCNEVMDYEFSPSAIM